jgi:hypothetical protein
VEDLPAVLADRPSDALTVVMTSVTTGYLDEERYQQLVRTLAQSGREAPLGWLALEAVRHDPESPVVLELTSWPGGATRRLAQVDPHAAWLEWL